MKNTILLVGVGCLLGACSGPATDVSEQVAAVQPPPPAVAAPSPPADAFLDPAKFRVARRDSFTVGPEGAYDYRDKHLVKLTAADEQKYLQRRIKHSQHQPYYFYTIHENAPSRQVITVLRDDGEYKLDLLRLVYDAEHKLISNQVVAYYAGDGGVGEDAYGRFETPTTFRFTEVMRENTRDDQDTMEYEIDSVVTRYSVRNERFRVSKKQKFHRHAIEVAKQE
ncbi:hypothetical protein LJY25_11060 [Hymenobacter sp. BT175]|uniref:hypothetical protein n=1 Tax=Hymenobacter translucens TaxID=2886507 RepID=UPI001D0F3F6A|nr:hypothetical protein [Hymenobacter translucens]MCC2546986.1 hypothetical protein [Hymenobacter translucens]